jgi:hypothetical protein
VGGQGLDLVSLLQEAVLCRPRGSPDVELDLTAVRLRLQGRAAEAWLASWLQAWFRWVDALAVSTVHARLSVVGRPARARLRLQFTSRRGLVDPAGAWTPLEAAPCWRTFMPLGTALHEVHPFAEGSQFDATGTRPSRHLYRVHIDLGPCRAGTGDCDS